MEAQEWVGDTRAARLREVTHHFFVTHLWPKIATREQRDKYKPGLVYQVAGRGLGRLPERWMLTTVQRCALQQIFQKCFHYRHVLMVSLSAQALRTIHCMLCLRILESGARFALYRALQLVYYSILESWL